MSEQPLNTTSTTDIAAERKKAAEDRGLSEQDSMHMSLAELKNPVEAPQEKSLREEAVEKLGISYADAVKMTNFELTQALGTQDQKTQPAENTIVQDPTPATQEDAPTLVQSTPVEASKTVDSENPILKNTPLYKEVYARAGAFATHIMSKFYDRLGGMSKKEKYAMGTTALFAFFAYKTGFDMNPLNSNNAFAAVTGESTGATSHSYNHQSQSSTGADTDLADKNTAQSTNAATSEDYNRYEQHSRDRMSTEGAFDGTERNMSELDDHVLAKIKNNPSLMSAVLEVRESGNKDANFSLADVNQDTRKFSVHGEHGDYSAKGDQAVDTLERSWNRGEQGKLLSDGEVKKLMDKYEFINHGTDSGNFKNALDDKVYDAGTFDYRPELGDQLYAKKLGNGETVYFKVNEKDPTRDCLNVQTLREKVAVASAEITTSSQPDVDADIDGPDDDNPDKDKTEDNPEDKPKLNPKDPSQAPPGHDNGDHLAPTPAESPDLSGDGVTPGNPTNPAPVQTPRPEPAPAPETPAPTPTNPATGPVNPSH